MTEATENKKKRQSDGRASAKQNEYSARRAVKQNYGKFEKRERIRPGKFFDDAPTEREINIPRVKTSTTRSNTSAGVAKPAAKSGAVSKPKTEAKTVTEAKVSYKKKWHVIDVPTKYAFPISLVAVGAVLVVMLMAVITTSVQINEITAVNSNLESSFRAKEKELNELNRLLETRDDLRIVERMAQEELGMVKIDQIERVDLHIRQEEKIEIIEETDEERAGVLDGITEIGMSFVERFKKIFGLD